MFLFAGNLTFFLIFFFFNDTATTEIYTLSLHDALPICKCGDKSKVEACHVPPHSLLGIFLLLKPRAVGFAIRGAVRVVVMDGGLALLA